MNDPIDDIAKIIDPRGWWENPAPQHGDELREAARVKARAVYAVIMDRSEETKKRLATMMQQQQ